MTTNWELTPDEIATYQRDGLVAPHLRLPEEVQAQMRTAVDTLLRENAQIAPESLVCPHIPYGEQHDEAAAAQWFSFATQPRVLQTCENRA
jgi:hypothetical protein